MVQFRVKLFLSIPLPVYQQAVISKSYNSKKMHSMQITHILIR